MCFMLQNYTEVSSSVNSYIPLLSLACASSHGSPLSNYFKKIVTLTCMNGTSVFVLPVKNAVQTQVRVSTKRKSLHTIKYHVKQKLKMHISHEYQVKGFKLLPDDH